MRGVRSLGVAVSVFAVGAISGRWAAGSSRAEREETYEKLEIFARVLNHVQTRYVATTDPSNMIYAAIRGITGALDERSAFLSPEEVDALRIEARRIHFDLGFTWAVDGDGAHVTSVTTGSAAQRRGVTAGQRIVGVDGRRARAESASAFEEQLYDLREAAKILQLEDVAGGSRRVRLRIEELVRPTVEVERADGVVHLRIVRFTEDTAAELVEALEGARPVRGLVLDLRGNSGGVVEAAARTVDAWLTEGTIATTEARDRVVEKFVAHAYGTEPSYPLAVLVDADTASAAELVGLALQEAGRADVFGEPTFGKGTVQTIIELEDGAALRLTVSRWFSGEHRSVEAGGIQPDHAASDRSALEMAMRWVRRGGR